MQALNIVQIQKSYRLFLLQFTIAVSFCISCIYCYLSGSEKAYLLLEGRVQQADYSLSKRKEINLLADQLLLRFSQLTRHDFRNAEGLNNQSIIMEDIQNINNKIKGIIKEHGSESASFHLYRKITDDVSQMSGIQDSLNTTRYHLESTRDQLQACVQLNKSIENKLKAGIFGRGQ